MFKYISLRVALFIFLIIFLLTILFGSLLVHYYEYGPRFPILQKFAINVASIPINFENIIKYGRGLKPTEKKFEVKKDNNGNYLKFYFYNQKPRDALLVLPEYDADKKRSIVKILDLNNFETIHHYDLEVEKIFNKLNVTYWDSTSRDNNSNERFVFGHPAILSDGSLIGKNVLHSPLFKIDICGNEKWVNNENNTSYHHSIEVDGEKNIWVSGTLREENNLMDLLEIPRNIFGIDTIYNDALLGINSENGKLIFKKSILELLMENNLIYDSDIMSNRDIIHINDVQPVEFNSKYMEKGDLFLSIRTLSSIIQYRPKDDKVVRYIRGPFIKQHDVDILGNTEIAIFNNNETFLGKNNSEIIIYNLENEKFTRLNNKSFIENNIFTKTEGLADFLNDGSYLVEETNKARLLFFDNKGNLEWIYLNIGKDGRNYPITWSRLISNKNLINDIKTSIINKKC